MTRCLDEATLQSYFDGELSAHLMERASAHLASCATCAAAARELAEETALLTSALAAEFETSVPTQALRERLDAAVLGERIPNTSRAERSGFFASLAHVFSFNSQRTLGYASLVVVLAFGGIFAIVKFKQTQMQPSTDIQAQAPSNSEATETIATAVRPDETPSIEQPVPGPAPVVAPIVKTQPPRSATPKAIPVKAPVQLLPGERSYLQQIAKLDTTIKSNRNGMRPSLQVEYERNLAVVDRAIAATRNAATSNPNDPDAADFMFAAYQSKVDLLNTIADARLTGGRGH